MVMIMYTRAADGEARVGQSHVRHLRHRSAGCCFLVLRARHWRTLQRPSSSFRSVISRAISRVVHRDRIYPSSAFNSDTKIEPGTKPSRPVPRSPRYRSDTTRTSDSPRRRHAPSCEQRQNSPEVRRTGRPLLDELSNDRRSGSLAEGARASRPITSLRTNLHYEFFGPLSIVRFRHRPDERSRFLLRLRVVALRRGSRQRASAFPDVLCDMFRRGCGNIARTLSRVDYKSLRHRSCADATELPAQRSATRLRI